MTKSEAIESIKSGNQVELVDRDATGQFAVRSAVWIEDGELIRWHPTQDRGTIAAPADGRYEEPH